MTCHTSARRLTAALHNPQGHSHPKPYVSETGHSLCLWRGVTDIYRCGQQRWLLIHKLSIAHTIKLAGALLGRLMNDVFLLRSLERSSLCLCFCLHSDALQRLTADRCLRQDWTSAVCRQLHLTLTFNGAVFGVEGKNGDDIV